MNGQLSVIPLVLSLARDYAMETRIRRLIQAHQEQGDQPKTLVMNLETWRQLVWELEGRSYHDGYFWISSIPASLPEDEVSTYLGVPILIKSFMADQEVIVGV